MDFFWTPRRWIANVILFSTLCNPLILHISNFISSDALFAALSLCWFTQLLWLIYNPTVRLLLLHSLILLLAFTVRYNALYYPIISLGILLLLNIRLGRKLIGISAISILLGSFIGYTQYRFQKETGVAQFSPFGGWQLATNALFAYGHVSPNERTLPPKKFKKLQTIVDKHIDSFQILLQTSDNKLGIYYLWNPRSPLRQYMRQKFLRDSTTRGFKQWALIAPMYKEYGYYLTNQYKGIFLKKYIWPNLVHYYSPPSEFLANYNMGKDTIEQTAVAWFGLNNNKIHSYFTDKKISLTEYIPIALAIINLVFIGSIIGFTWLGGFNATESLNKRTLKLMLIVWTSNMLFSVIASPIVLRYQVFPMIIAEIFLVYLLDFIIQKSKSCQSFSIINKPETVVTLEVMRNEV